ncbi:MAG: hypothetical protein WCG86_06965, partial [Actinomycetota bacterium]
MLTPSRDCTVPATAATCFGSGDTPPDGPPGTPGVPVGAVGRNWPIAIGAGVMVPVTIGASVIPGIPEPVATAAGVTVHVDTWVTTADKSRVTVKVASIAGRLATTDAVPVSK